MRDDKDRGMNLMRGLLQACEEGAIDELNDGSDGNEPWTEHDRRASRATAEWIRATFFASPLASGRYKPKLRRRVGEQFFSDEKLWVEFESTDLYRRRCAIESIDALASLAEVRARKRCTNFLVERHAVYDVALLNADIEGNDRELYDAAFRVWDEVTHLAALVDADTIELTEEQKEWFRRLHESTLTKLAEMERPRKAVKEGRP